MQEFGCLFLSAPLDPSASDINVKVGTPAGAVVPFHASFFFFPQIKSQNDVVRLQQRYRVVVGGGIGGPLAVGGLADHRNWAASLAPFPEDEVCLRLLWSMYILTEGQQRLEGPRKWPEEYLLNVSELTIKTRTEDSFLQLHFPFSDPTKRRCCFLIASPQNPTKSPQVKR